MFQIHFELASILKNRKLEFLRFYCICEFYCICYVFVLFPFCRIRNLSSKQWLWKHGLIAKKLTLLDALAPTFIPHKAKYVPILDKHVLSKVFDEV